MSEIKNVGQTWMAKCNRLTSLPFKGLIEFSLLVTIRGSTLPPTSLDKASQWLLKQTIRMSDYKFYVQQGVH